MKYKRKKNYEKNSHTFKDKEFEKQKNEQRQF